VAAAAVVLVQSKMISIMSEMILSDFELSLGEDRLKHIASCTELVRKQESDFRDREIQEVKNSISRQIADGTHCVTLLNPIEYAIWKIQYDQKDRERDEMSLMREEDTFCFSDAARERSRKRLSEFIKSLDILSSDDDTQINNTNG
jgi:hypothetical protein